MNVLYVLLKPEIGSSLPAVFTRFYPPTLVETVPVLRVRKRLQNIGDKRQNSGKSHSSTVLERESI